MQIPEVYLVPVHHLLTLIDDDYVVLLPFWYLSTVRIYRLTVILLPDHIIFETSSDSSIVPDIILHLPWRGKQVDNKVCRQ